MKEYVIDLDCSNYTEKYHKMMKDLNIIKYSGCLILCVKLLI